MRHIRYFVFLYILIKLLVSCSDESNIADAPCQITNISVDGAFTVSSYVQKGSIIRRPFTGYLLGVGKVSSIDAERITAFLEANIEMSYVSASVNEDGKTLSILCINEKTNKAIELVQLLNSAKLP